MRDSSQIPCQKTFDSEEPVGEIVAFICCVKKILGVLSLKFKHRKNCIKITNNLSNNIKDLTLGRSIVEGIALLSSYQSASIVSGKRRHVLLLPRCRRSLDTQDR